MMCPVMEPAERWRIEELHRYLSLELAESDSVNTRATQLAALTGVTTALIGTIAKDREITWLTGLTLVLATLALLVAAGTALCAAYPRRPWRRVLSGVPDRFASVPAREPTRSTLAALLEMIRLQMEVNDSKVKLMNTAYVAFGVGLVLSAVAIGLLLAGDPATNA